MRFDHDARVTAADGETIGRLDRVVLDPRTKRVTHIIVHKGGFLTQDRVVPMECIESSDQDGVVLNQKAVAVEQLPEFRDSEYLPLDEEELGDVWKTYAYAAPLYWYPPAGLPLFTLPVPKVERTRENIPEGTIPLKEGARVVTRDGKTVGSVEEVVTDEETQRATRFLISKGRMMKERIWVPMTWIDRVEEDEVRLAVGSRIVEQLRTVEQPIL
jgi:uncharacterized protein YrrD